MAQEELTLAQVRELLIESLSLHTKLVANLRKLEDYNGASGRPDWWRQRQKDASQSIWSCRDKIEEARHHLESSLAELEERLASG